MRYKLTIVANSDTPMGLIETVLKQYGCEIAGFEPFDVGEFDTTNNVVPLHPAKSVGSTAKKQLSSPPKPAPDYSKRPDSPTKAALDIIAKMPAGKKFTTEEMHQIMLPMGFNKQCVRNTLRNLLDRKLLAKNGYGGFQKNGEWKEPGKAAATATHGGSRAPRLDGKTTASVVWDYLAKIPDGFEVTTKELAEELAKHGFVGSSYGAGVTAIMKDNPGKLVKVGMGLYKVNHIKPMPSEMQPETNIGGESANGQ